MVTRVVGTSEMPLDGMVAVAPDFETPTAPPEETETKLRSVAPTVAINGVRCEPAVVVVVEVVGSGEVIDDDDDEHTVDTAEAPARVDGAAEETSVEEEAQVEDGDVVEPIGAESDPNAVPSADCGAVEVAIDAGGIVALNCERDTTLSPDGPIESSRALSNCSCSNSSELLPAIVRR